MHRSFMSAARGFAKTKPIIIVKPNRIDENQNLYNLRYRLNSKKPFMMLRLEEAALFGLKQ